jgi:hypothetical protein
MGRGCFYPFPLLISPVQAVTENGIWCHYANLFFSSSLPFFYFSILFSRPLSFSLLYLFPAPATSTSFSAAILSVLVFLHSPYCIYLVVMAAACSISQCPKNISAQRLEHNRSSKTFHRRTNVCPLCMYEFMQCFQV